MIKSSISFLAASIVLLLPTVSQAGRFDDLVEAMLRKPLNVVDHIDKPLLTGGDTLKWTPPIRKADDDLLKQFNRLEGANDDLRDTFKKLTKSERNILVELVGAGQRVARARNADDAIVLIRKLDTDGLIQIRTYGDFVYEGVEKMGPGYKAVIAKMGKGAGRFFNEWIEPHWGKWTAAGLTAAYLAAPEKFHDAIGNLTEYAIQKLIEAGIRVGEGVTGGITKGIIARMEANPIFASVTLILVSFILMLQVPLLRQMFNRRVTRPIFNLPTDTGPTAKEPLTPSDYEE